MKWSDVIEAKTQGGLELGCFVLKNHVLLAKWCWGFGN